MVLPWSGFWERNYFAQTWPELVPFITNTFVRGGITGLGLLNLVAGFSVLAPVFMARESRDARLLHIFGSPFSVLETADRTPQNDEPHADTRVDP